MPKSPSLDPGVGSWTVEVTFRPDNPDRIVLAHGGKSFGYCLSLEGGKPTFTVVSEEEPTRAAGTESVVGRWVVLRGAFNQSEVSLEVDGVPSSRVKIWQPLDRTPHEGLRIGADLGTSVLGTQRPKFTGLIERVRLYSGQPPSALSGAAT